MTESNDDNMLELIAAIQCLAATRPELQDAAVRLIKGYRSVPTEIHVDGKKTQTALAKAAKRNRRRG